jgi:uncharacterized protein with GYD domain
MAKFMINVSYSSGSWARMIKNPDNRVSAASSLLESLGGSLDQLYWDIEGMEAYAIATLPDQITAAAVATAVVGTGAFRGAHVHQLLDQDQLTDVVLLSANRGPKPLGAGAIGR